MTGRGATVEAVHADTGEVVKVAGVHPVADLFPGIDGEELAELASSIKADGQHHPIVLDAKRRVLDGRNRLAACQQAGVKPTVVLYEGNDPDGYAYTVNATRRSLTKGQKAMIAAQVTERYSRSTSTEVSKQRLSYARTVLTHAPDLVEAVVSGATSLNDAYKTARERKADAASAEKRMAELRETRPDLADQVAEERLTLAAAMGAMREDEAARDSELRAKARNLESAVGYLTSTVLAPADLAQQYAPVLDQFDAKRLTSAAKTMSAIAETKKQERRR